MEEGFPGKCILFLLNHLLGIERVFNCRVDINREASLSGFFLSLPTHTFTKLYFSDVLQDYWPNFRQSDEPCDISLLNNLKCPLKYRKLCQIPVPETLFITVHIDILGPLNPARGYKYIL
uniref:Uncharacterized protein n=1 Tax=Lygus hesperus TaxID=30085 RepID=A0A146LPU1_LYGHE